jgi:hypothetical protein
MTTFMPTALPSKNQQPYAGPGPHPNTGKHLDYQQCNGRVARHLESSASRIFPETKNREYDFVNEVDPSMISHVPNYLPLLRNSRLFFSAALRDAVAMSH